MEMITERRAHLANLLAAVAGGSEHAFNELHGLTRAYLHNVALRLLGSQVHAEEVLQEAYVNVWTSAHRFQPTFGSPMTWLITIVRNQALSLLRSQRLERQWTLQADDPSALEEAAAADSDEADPIRQAFYASLRDRLPAALAELEPGQRQSIALTYGQGMAHAELSQHLDVPLGTVKSWLRRGLLRLNHSLVRERTAAAQLPFGEERGVQGNRLQC